jgi:HD domain
VAIGGDFAAYRNHTYRVVNLCVALSPATGEDLQKICIAAAFHDMGIWTAGTFDYLSPSVTLAHAHLARIGKSEWAEVITAMILEHHKISTYRGAWTVVDAFRRADWVDVSMGLRSFGLSGTTVDQIRRTWPSAGFHWRLVELTLERWRRHPLSPLPMLRL